MATTAERVRAYNKAAFAKQDLSVIARLKETARLIERAVKSGDIAEVLEVRREYRSALPLDRALEGFFSKLRGVHSKSLTLVQAEDEAALRRAESAEQTKAAAQAQSEIDRKEAARIRALLKLE